MLVNNKGYVTEYWMFNNIVDCGEVSNSQELDINIAISELELELLNEYEEEKLNNEYMNDNNNKYYGSQYNEFDSNNRKCKNTNYPKSKGRNRNKNKSYRMYDETESCQHIYLQKTVSKNCNKGAVQELSKNSRLYEYRGSQRKIMLDSFTKPILDYT